jgi:hypothetical protein
MQWGRLGYDPSLEQRFFESALHERYPSVDAALLYETWATSSQIMPQINRFFFKRGDHMFTPEDCQSARGFITVDHLIEGSSDTVPGAKEIGIRDFLKLTGPADAGRVTTPFAAADNLDTFARDTLTGCQRLRASVALVPPELHSVLTDLEAMSWMGRYYADKIRGATRLAQFRQSGDLVQKAAAVVALENAAQSWRAYAQLAASQYRPQVLARGRKLDWHAVTREVDQEIAAVRAAERESPDKAASNAPTKNRASNSAPAAASGHQ